MEGDKSSPLSAGTSPVLESQVFYFPRPSLTIQFRPILTLIVAPTNITFKGTILNLGADWGLVDNNGTFSADTRYGLNTTDGTHLYLRTSGPQQADGDLFLRIKIETSVVSKYAWLNDVVAVGVLKNLGAGPNGRGFTLRIDSWMVSNTVV